MIPVTITCEAEPRPAEAGEEARFTPVVRLNGEAVWRGRPVTTAGEAEQVALGYLRYTIGGTLMGPADGRGGGEADPGQAAPGGAVPLAQSIDQVMDGLRREIADSMQRLQEFIDGGEWRRFLP